ncbi:MAG TPA: hypothetical protein VLS90_09505, partial [Thermodesulfobacteriota bacterium]|nr:hypothetical protein [Thermodesulfobacteriota bacterium]
GSFGAGRGIALLAFAVLAVAGLSALFRRSWFGAVILVWIALPIAGLGFFQPHRYIPLRYLLVIQPLYLLLVGLGCLQIVRWAARVGRALGLPGKRGGKAFRWVPVGAALVGIALPMWPLTLTGYRVEKGNDWTRICDYIRAHARPGEVIAAEDYAFPIMGFRGLKSEGGLSIVSAEGLSSGRGMEAGRAVWYVAFEPAPAEARFDFPAGDFVRIPRADYSAQGLLPAGLEVPGRLAFPSFERAAALFRRGATRAPDQIKFGGIPGDKKRASGARIEPGHDLDVVLSLPATSPRVLEVTLQGRGAKGLIFFADGRRIGEITTKEWGRRQEVSFPLLASDLETIHLRIINEGAEPALVKSVEVGYAPPALDTQPDKEARRPGYRLK